MGELEKVAPEEKFLGKDFSGNFLAMVGMHSQKSPTRTLCDDILGKVVDQEHDCYLRPLYDPDKGFNVDGDIATGGTMTASSDLAFISFMLSSYYKDVKQKSKAASHLIYKVKKANNNAEITATYDFYNLKGLKLDAKQSAVTTDQDMILASILGLNCLVKKMRSSGMAGMHPLSRVTATEGNLKSLLDYIKDHQGSFKADYEDNISIPVKMFNLACTRKAHQFYNETKFYCPELAAAVLITGVMSAPKQTQNALMTIANSSLAKIVKSSGGLNTDMVTDLMAYTSTGSSAQNVVEIYDAFMSKKKKKFEDEKAMSPTALLAFIKANPGLFPSTSTKTSPLGTGTGGLPGS